MNSLCWNAHLIVITQISEAVINPLYDYAELAHESMSTVMTVKHSVISTVSTQSHVYYSCEIHNSDTKMRNLG